MMVLWVMAGRRPLLSGWSAALKAMICDEFSLAAACVAPLRELGGNGLSSEESSEMSVMVGAGLS